MIEIKWKPKYKTELVRKTNDGNDSDNINNDKNDNNNDSSQSKNFELSIAHHVRS